MPEEQIGGAGSVVHRRGGRAAMVSPRIMRCHIMDGFTNSLR